MVFKTLSTALLLLPFITGQPPPPEECCEMKMVGNFEYRFMMEGMPGLPASCMNACIYKRVDNGKMYCFAPGDLHVECEDEDVTGAPDGDCTCVTQDTITPMVQILNRSTSEPLCMGLLTASNLIMAPGSCMEGVLPEDISVTVGIFTQTVYETSVDVEQILLHENISHVSLLMLTNHVDLNIYIPLCSPGSVLMSPLKKQGGSNITSIVEDYERQLCEDIISSLEESGVTEEIGQQICSAILELSNYVAYLECQLSLGVVGRQAGGIELPDFPQCFQELMNKDIEMIEWIKTTIDEEDSFVCMAAITESDAIANGK